MCCLGFSRFFFSDTFELLHQSEKHDEKERLFFFFFFFKCLVILLQENKRKKKENLSRKKKPVGGAFNKRQRRDFETTRFSFSFLLRTRREKKDTFETKRIISSSSEESARFERTQTHTKPEREKDDAFFFSDIYLLFVYFVFVLFARYRERERKREDILSSRLFVKERENIEIRKERRRH